MWQQCCVECVSQFREIRELVTMLGQCCSIASQLLGPSNMFAWFMIQNAKQMASQPSTEEIAVHNYSNAVKNNFETITSFVYALVVTAISFSSLKSH